MVPSPGNPAIWGARRTVSCKDGTVLGIVAALGFVGAVLVCCGVQLVARSTTSHSLITTPAARRGSGLLIMMGGLFALWMAYFLATEPLI